MKLIIVVNAYGAVESVYTDGGTPDTVVLYDAEIEGPDTIRTGPANLLWAAGRLEYVGPDPDFCTEVFGKVGEK